MFNLKKYHQNLNTQWLGHQVNYFEKLGSTNSYLKKIAADEISHGQICLTDHQTNGRGQYERGWQSNNNQNLTFTLLFRPATAERFHILTLACARAVIKQIENQTDCSAFIKWPNDILINGKKITGILTEAVFNGNNPDRLLVGIGMNINQERFADNLRSKAGSLKTESGKPIDREQFLSSLLAHIEFEYTRWHKKQDDTLLPWINQKIIGYGQWISLQIDDKVKPGKFKLLGIDHDGNLAVIDREGGIKTFAHEQIRIIAD